VTGGEKRRTSDRKIGILKTDIRPIKKLIGWRSDDYDLMITSLIVCLW
jgi:hypothetical protein